MRLDRAAGHFELCSDFRVVTALQQQFGDLLLPRAQTNRLFLHVNIFLRGEIITNAAKGSFPQVPCCKRLRRPAQRKHRVLAGSPEFHSIHAAKWTGFPQSTVVSVLTIDCNLNKLSQIAPDPAQIIGHFIPFAPFWEPKLSRKRLKLQEIGDHRMKRPTAVSCCG